MNKTCKRLLIFFIGIPIILGIVFLKAYNHLALSMTIIVFSALAAYEFYNMVCPTYKLLPKPVLIILTAALPFFAYIFTLINLDLNILSWILLFEIVLLMGIQCFTEKEFSDSIARSAISVLLLFYCGYMLTFINRLTLLENSVQFISLFFILVFMCDSSAWFFGILFGKSTKGYVACSPNKSIVGFIGGLAGCIASGVLMKVIFSDIFFGSYWKMILLSFVCGCTSIIGDLIESLFKRSCNVKDSGKLIPGRGGVLDSVDSLILTSPVFYLGIYFLYNI